MVGLVDIMLRAEAALERRLCGLAMFQPKTIALLQIRPEIDLAAIAFFVRFDKHRNDILAAEELDAIRIAYNCCPTFADFYRFFDTLAYVNTVQYVQKIRGELTAARIGRKALRWIETSGILQEASYGG